MSLVALRTWREGTCRVELESEILLPLGDDGFVARWQVSFREDQSLPVSVVAEGYDGARAAGDVRALMRLDMVAATMESPPVIEAYAPRPPAPLEAPRERRDAAIMRRCCGFATSLAVATEQARRDPTAAAWLSDHPDAKPVKVDHGLGALGSDTVDYWAIEWSDGTSGLTTRVFRQLPRVPLALVDPKFVVRTSPGDALPPPPDADWISLAHLDAWHLAHTGQRIEVVGCDAILGACLVGTHQSKNEPRKAPFGADAAVTIGGFIVRMETGRIVTDQSLAGVGLAPPVPLP